MSACRHFKNVALFCAVISYGPIGFADFIDSMFESNFDGWTPFTTSNGTLGPSPLPSLSRFDVTGDSFESNSVKLNVGYAVAPCLFPSIACARPSEGGGIRKFINFSDGFYALNVDVAVENNPTLGGFNRDGGVFELFLSGVPLNRISIDEILAGTVERRSLSAITFIDSGLHEITLFVTRGARPSASLSQYIDNFRILRIPEPRTHSLIVLGIAVALSRSQRHNKRMISLAVGQLGRFTARFFNVLISLHLLSALQSAPYAKR